ncbi:MAG: hypothetical protein WCI04_00545 [archaeon]
MTETLIPYYKWIDELVRVLRPSISLEHNKQNDLDYIRAFATGYFLTPNLANTKPNLTRSEVDQLKEHLSLIRKTNSFGNKKFGKEFVFKFVTRGELFSGPHILLVHKRKNGKTGVVGFVGFTLGFPCEIETIQGGRIVKKSSADGLLPKRFFAKTNTPFYNALIDELIFRLNQTGNYNQTIRNKTKIVFSSKAFTQIKNPKMARAILNRYSTRSINRHLVGNHRPLAGAGVNKLATGLATLENREFAKNTGTVPASRKDISKVWPRVDREPTSIPIKGWYFGRRFNQKRGR